MDNVSKYFSTSPTEPTLNPKASHSAVQHTIHLKTVLLRITKMVAEAAD